MKVFVSIVGTIVVLIGAAILFIYSGIFNIAASDPHNPAVRWVLETTMRQSVKARAEEVAVPELGDPAMVARGGRHYRESCQTCHAGPGVERSEMGRGMRPTPPRLAREVTHWSSAELFWIVKHGIKMTGMPAWGESHGDEDLWAIVAFLERLPKLSPQEYQQLTSGSGAAEGSH